MHAFQTPFSNHAAGAVSGMYRQVGISTGIEDATPHRLVAMLFDGLLESMARARGAMRVGDIETKGVALGRASRIVEEGLKNALNLTEGGSLAQDLHDLYAYVTRRLMMANLHNDVAAVDECYRLIEPLQEAWNEIAGKATVAPHARINA
jgi:flagellar protein FliS